MIKFNTNKKEITLEEIQNITTPLFKYSKNMVSNQLIYLAIMRQTLQLLILI